MCKYEYKNEKGENATCIYPQLYEELKKNPSEFTEMDFNLPIDEDGFCIFHSKNIEWKREQGFFNKFLDIISVLNSHAVNRREKKERRKFFDFSGFTLIGNDNIIDFTELKFQEYPKFKNAIFIDKLLFSNTVFVNGCQFEKSVFKNNVEIKHTKFLDVATFEGAIFENKFDCIDTTFDASVIFTDAIFEMIVGFRNCEFNGRVMFDKVYCKNNDLWFTLFNSKFNQHAFAVFDRTKFEGLVKFENIEFNSNVSFIYSEFNLNDNTDPNNCSVNFDKIILKNNALMQFKGRKPFERMFKNDVFFTFKDEVIGNIYFENVDFNSMDAGTIKDFKLLEETKKLVVGNGCVRDKVNNIKIFIASQDILNPERDFIEKIIREKNDDFVPKQIYLKPKRYENVDKGNTDKRIQDEFMKLIDSSEYFILILWNSIGNYSKEEFEYAISNRLAGKNPEKILVLNKTNNADFDEKYRDMSFDSFLSDLKNKGIYIINFTENLTIYRELNLLFNEIEIRYKSK